MEMDKSLISRSMVMLVLKLLEDRDMYGYQMVNELRRRSDDSFHLKAGSLYPLLYSLEEKGYVTSFETVSDDNRARRYYHLTKTGGKVLREMESAWENYANAVRRVLRGGACCAEV